MYILAEFQPTKERKSDRINLEFIMVFISKLFIDD